MTAPPKTPPKTASTRADRLVAAAREAGMVRAYQTDPDVVALRVERVRGWSSRLIWVGIILGLCFTMTNVQQFAAQGAEPGSLPWLTAWLLDPMVSLVLIGVLLAEQVTARYQVPMGRWPRIAKWGALAATYTMNTWQAWAAGNVALIVLHSVPPLMVFVAVEAFPVLRDRLTEAVLAAERDAHRRRPLDPDPAVTVETRQQAQSTETVTTGGHPTVSRGGQETVTADGHAGTAERLRAAVSDGDRDGRTGGPRGMVNPAWASADARSPDAGHQRVNHDGHPRVSGDATREMTATVANDNPTAVTGDRNGGDRARDRDGHRRRSRAGKRGQRKRSLPDPTRYLGAAWAAHDRLVERSETINRESIAAEIGIKNTDMKRAVWERIKAGDRLAAAEAAEPTTPRDDNR